LAGLTWLMVFEKGQQTHTTDFCDYTHKSIKSCDKKKPPENESDGFYFSSYPD